MPTAATQRWSHKKVVEAVQGPSFWTLPAAGAWTKILKYADLPQLPLN
jgi:hypothetical protein